MNSKTRLALVLAAAMAALAACDQTQAIYPEKVPGDTTPTWSNEQKPGLFGSGGLNLFGGDSKKRGEEGVGIGVNAFLWRASLDTIAFMPLASADPFGGVIITDWYSPPETPQERFKLSVFILDRTLRADAVRVSMFRQVHAGQGGWTDAAVNPKTAVDLENAILTRAREIRGATPKKD